MRIPIATYRLQLTGSFGFQSCRSMVPYLDALGASDLYASPIFAARRGSLSGYDVTDPTRLNPELGSEADFEALARELASRTMGIVLDIVPNHMAASHENAWWREVLESGPLSPRASFFDIRWKPMGKASSQRAMLPVLGDLYGRVLERGELAIAFEEGALVLRYYDARFPLDPRSWPAILELARREIERSGGSRALESELMTLCVDLEAADSRSTAEAAAREGWKRRLSELCSESEECRRAIERALSIVNGRKGDPGSFEMLDRILENQHYRLAYWRTGMEKLNYRRFFDISDLVGVRIQEPRVFEEVHALTRRLVREGAVTGLRVDHVDGLSDPRGYLERLKEIGDGEGDRKGNGEGEGDGRGRGERRGGIYTIVEKILMPGERLPPEWPVAGTTGYDFLNAVNRVFVSPDGYLELERIHAGLTGVSEPFERIVRQKKRQVIEEIFPSETRALAAELGRLAEAHRHARDLSAADLERALIEMTCSLPVYRTYVATSVREEDRSLLEETAREAARETGGRTADAVFFLLDVLLLEGKDQLAPEDLDARARFARRWQQYSGPVMAKGLEDTALYAHAGLLSLNDVGGRPGADGMSPRAFHDWILARKTEWPHSMNATSTHDTKRSEDVRARLDVLSEMPDEWQRRLKSWMRGNSGKKEVVDGVPIPRPLGEVFYYQTLAGAWPLDPAGREGFRERLEAYAIKAAREAKMETRWTAPHGDYERALTGFIRRTLEPSGADRFLDDFSRFASRLAYWGAFNSLGMTLVKIAAPGVPDFYQGTELWDLSLVDPDNRRPVDFGMRKDALDAVSTPGRAVNRDLLRSWSDGRIKMYVTARALGARRRDPGLFLEGDYLPLSARGSRAGNVLAFARRRGDAWAIAVAPRLVSKMARPGKLAIPDEAWEDTVLVLPPGAPDAWRNVFVDGGGARSETREIPMAEVLSGFPVGLLAGE